jgi:hypothetical protein
MKAPPPIAQVKARAEQRRASTPPRGPRGTPTPRRYTEESETLHRKSAKTSANPPSSAVLAPLLGTALSCREGLCPVLTAAFLPTAAAR